MHLWIVLLALGCLRAPEGGGPLELEIVIEEEPGGSRPSLSEEKALFDVIKSKVISKIRDRDSLLRELSDNGQPKNGKVVVLPHRVEVENKNGMMSMLNGRKSFVAEEGRSRTDTNVSLEYTDEMLKIGTDKNLFLTIVSNLDSIETMGYRPSIGEIDGISVYRNGSGGMSDFWNRLTFESRDGRIRDRTLYFVGIPNDTTESLLKSSRMGRSGFFISRDVSEQDELVMVYRLKKLITEVAYFKKISVPELMARNKPLSMIDDIIFFNYYPLKPNDVVNVCICQNGDCKTPCTEVRRINRKNLL
eukprot:Pompholyxophrys_punicea_v1_NODE_17_length_5980_cov_2.985654.p3 type:complete len:304 gc:universal NODE_17_length_5980_cov_2.985654:1162-251(-)